MDKIGLAVIWVAIIVFLAAAYWASIHQSEAVRELCIRAEKCVCE